MKIVLVTIPCVLVSLVAPGCGETPGEGTDAVTTNSPSGTETTGTGTQAPPGATPGPSGGPTPAQPPGSTGATGPGATGATGPGATGSTGATAGPPGMAGAGNPGPGPVGAAGAGAGGAPPSGGGSSAGGATPSGGAPAGGAAAGGAASGGASPGGPVTVQLTQERQLIRGFGINNNWAPLGSNAQRLFGNGPGELGMNILRVGMGSDGEPYNGTSCYDDIDTVTGLGAEYIMATLWSPPAECKDSGTIADGGHLLESCYGSWSDTIAAFADKISQNTNTSLYAMSPQNETDFASCGRSEPCNGNYDTTVMNGAEAAEFQKIVGPKLRAKNVIPMSAEASEWIHVWSNNSACCSEPSGLPSSDPLDCGIFETRDGEVTGAPGNCTAGAPFDDGYEYGYALWADQEAWDAFDIMGTHQYDSQIAYAWPADVTDKKEVWQTEMSGVKWWPEQGEVDGSGVLTTCSTTIENGVAVARWIHSGLTVGEASAWLYWWYQAIDTDDNEGLICKDGREAKRLWTFGQFSKFIRPGHTIVEITGDVPANVMLVASKSPEGGVVVVAINETTAAVDLPITIAGGTAPASLTPHVTSADDDIAEKDAVTVTEGAFTASLPAMSVTTYVSN